MLHKINIPISVQQQVLSMDQPLFQNHSPTTSDLRGDYLSVRENTYWTITHDFSSENSLPGLNTMEISNCFSEQESSSEVKQKKFSVEE